MNKQTPQKGAVLVTGASKRIGRAICLSLAQSGYDIALHYHQSSQEAEATAQEIRKKGKLCALFPCDLAKSQPASLLVKEAYKKFPHLNVLINNASVFEVSTLKTTSIENLEYQLSVNLKAPLILSRDFANTCKRGHIINIVDTHIVKNKTTHFIYLLTKKALFELTQLAAFELAPGIRVNAVAPGFILSPEKKEQNHFKKRTKNIPLKQKGNVKEVTQTIEFLLANPYIAGQTIFCDGGEHLV